MLIKEKITVRPFINSDKMGLADLIHYHSHVHRHLDWRHPLEWAGKPPFLVGEVDGRLGGVLSVPEHPPEVAWIRFFASADWTSFQEIWDTLWNNALHELRAKGGIRLIASLSLDEWFSKLLKKSGFEIINHVVTLIWDSTTIVPNGKIDIKIRNMTYDDLARVAELDSISFPNLWCNTLDDLQLAFRQAAIATVAESERNLVGYQICTSTQIGGHLARLAVHPQMQGQGIGGFIIHDLMQQFKTRGAQAITVNTQSDNYSSLALYKKLGFGLTGENYPVFGYPLSNH
jgi:ribosomal protein S18 acetylase RimI-like enzyme